MTGYELKRQSFLGQKLAGEGPWLPSNLQWCQSPAQPENTSQPANKSLNNNRKITKLCCQSCSFRPLPFTWNRKNSRKRAYILKDSGCILFLPFGNKVLTSKETVFRMSPAAVPWGVFFEFLFKAVHGSFRNNSEPGFGFFFLPNCKQVTVLGRSKNHWGKENTLLPSLTVINHTQMKIKSLAGKLSSFSLNEGIMVHSSHLEPSVNHNSTGNFNKIKPVLGYEVWIKILSF